MILKLFNASLRWETHSAQYTGLLEHGGHCPTIRTRSKSGCLLNVSTGKGYLQSSLQPVLSSPVALVQNLGEPTHPRTVLPDCPANDLIVYQPADGLIDRLPLATCSNRGLGGQTAYSIQTVPTLLTHWVQPDQQNAGDQHLLCQKICRKKTREAA